MKTLRRLPINLLGWKKSPNAVRVSPEFRKWLIEPGSMTEKLETFFSGFQIYVVKQQWEKSLLSEALALGRKKSTMMLIREVVIICDGQVFMYARTIIPEALLRGPLHVLRKLGNRPLGTLLFANPRIKRGPFEFNQLPHAGFTWARRSTFTLNNHSLLLSEFFTTAMLEAIKKWKMRKT